EGIHFHGNRCKKPFVELPVTSYIKNCDILYADLSGTRKGAYTGAENRDGKIKMADGGTLFTNQVNSLPLDAQDGLLGFFDGNGVNMFGTAAPLDVDVRHIVSANEDLEVLTNKGKFRRDLYHRLNTVEIKVPPLKERKEDIPLLVKYFLRMYNEKYIKKGHGPFEISDSDIDKLADYPWPGNVRELKSVIEKGVIFGKIETPKYNIEIPTGDFQISPDDFSELGISLTKFIEETEKSLIENTVRQTNNLTDAAKLLKIPKRSLRYMINKYEIEK
ncbi:MAG: sigma-54-dependent Fis family transcriptional regulator, partial [Candidatus Aenigmarchaeota archaeon]|nr:sigma-54-dependent Fis family transcriptional regulator [Candidatus Aenigmarchaeota archaeon]